MTVYIARSNDSGYYLVDSYGTPVRGVWFSDYIDAEDYCGEHGLIIGAWEEED